MRFVLGIDIGTSAVKVLLLDYPSGAAWTAGSPYVFIQPQSGWFEQDPDCWWRAVCLSIQRVLSESGADASAIEAVSFSGQMHGLVALDANRELLMPAIIWMDQRSVDILPELERKIERMPSSDRPLNRVATGYMLSSLYWLQKKSPEIFDKIAMVLLPKDYVRFRLTGEAATDYTDGSGSLCEDVADFSWARNRLQYLGLPTEIFPLLLAPTARCGAVGAEAARETGLRPGTPVVVGAADQPMQNVGNGILDAGVVSCNIGSGAQISTPVKKLLWDSARRCQTFIHAPSATWFIQGACLNGGNGYDWFCRSILRNSSFAETDKKIAAIAPGACGLLYLPYLLGERSPIMDPQARGLFCGLSHEHTVWHLGRAVLEGITFGLKESLDLIAGLGVRPERIVASGGGSQSPLWLQIQADIFNLPVYRTEQKEAAAFGAAITAAVGVGLYKDYHEACAALVRRSGRLYEPEAAAALRYQELAQVFNALYRANQGIFQTLARYRNFDADKN